MGTGLLYTAQSFNPLPTNDCKSRHETFTFMMSHPAMSLGDRLCASRKGGAGGGGWVHPKGANSMAVPGLSFEQPLVGAGYANSWVLSINRPRKQWSHLAEPRIPVFKADFSARASYRRPSILITYTLTSGCGQNHEWESMAVCSSV